MAVSVTCVDCGAPHGRTPRALRCLVCVRSRHREATLMSTLAHREQKRKSDRSWKLANHDRVLESERARRERKRKIANCVRCGSPHGRSPRARFCIACVRSRKVERRRAWTLANRDRARNTQRAWKLANPDRSRETSRVWALINQEHVRQSKRAWGLANRERRRETQRTWYLANREYALERARAYQVSHRALITRRDRERRERERGPVTIVYCVDCGHPVDRGPHTRAKTCVACSILRRREAKRARYWANRERVRINWRAWRRKQRRAQLRQIFGGVTA